jgi:hypothetical protein
MDRDTAIAMLSGQTPPPTQITAQEAPPADPKTQEAAIPPAKESIGDPTQAPEASAESTETKESPKELDSARFARLAKHEAKLQAERQAFKDERTKFDGEKEQLRSVQSQIQEFERLKKEDPIKAIKFLGFTDTDVVNFMSQEEKTPEQKAQEYVDAKLKERDEKEKTEREAANKQQTEAQKQVEAQAIQEFKGSIGTVVESDKDKYEYCSFHGAAANELIFETVLECLKEDMKTNPKATPISAQEAADMVEKYYEDQDKAMSTLKKRGVKKETSANEELVSTGLVGEKPTVGRPMPQKTTIPKTLAKTTASTAASVPAKTTTPMTREQKREAIIAKIKAGEYSK